MEDKSVDSSNMKAKFKNFLLLQRTQSCDDVLKNRKSSVGLSLGPSLRPSPLTQTTDMPLIKQNSGPNFLVRQRKKIVTRKPR